MGGGRCDGAATPGAESKGQQSGQQINIEIKKRTSFYTPSKFKFLLTVTVNPTNNCCDFLKVIFCWGGAPCDYSPQAPREPSHATSKHIMLIKTIVKNFIIFLIE